MPTWMNPNDLHPLIAWGIVCFYAAFLVWILASFVSWRRARAARAIDLDLAAAPVVARPAFAEEDLQRKGENRAAGAAYRNPEALRKSRAVTSVAEDHGRGAGADAWSALQKVIGIVVLVLGMAFIALTLYAFLARPAPGSPLSWLLSERAAEAMLSTHWLMLVLTFVRVGVGMLRPRQRPSGVVAIRGGA